MKKRWKNLKPWKRRIIITFSFLLMVLLTTITWIYIDLKSKDMTEIQERLDVREQENTSSSEEINPDSLPSSVEGHLEKAEEFADKPIEMEDALDVTSILLNSGLSIKEMQYLTGQVREDLTPEELKHIRDTLLAKLSQEEIDALRQIARYYGRTLNILDPNFPIPGLKDETSESSQIEDNVATQKNEPVVTDSQTTEDQTEENQHENLTPVTQEVEQKYLTQIEPLQNTCEAKVNDLADEIRADIDKKTANGEQVTVQYLQNAFLQKFVQAEGECDTQFEDLMTQAEQEFATESFNPEIIDQWRQTYQNVKDETSNKILNDLKSQIENSGS
ncbi:hypothetical protein [Chengkuizengella sediminis]|uniref:hypothetical protein n=1 Tax=Chengkuizengella sediminis TaxID=1885917 RepID=UPI001389C43E|nr:hypothetical protein [Chengkuizengella sediminis]NDI34873.1 hypothetical protein [Chengkuizengella sediminis]